jgi:hypothetical protein
MVMDIDATALWYWQRHAASGAGSGERKSFRPILLKNSFSICDGKILAVIGSEVRFTPRGYMKVLMSR